MIHAQTIFCNSYSDLASECLNHRNDIKLAKIMQKLMWAQNTNQVIFQAYKDASALVSNHVHIIIVKLKGRLW